MAQNLVPQNPELSREQIVTTLIQPLQQQSAILGAPGIRIFDLAASFAGPIRVPRLLDAGLADPTPADLDAPGTPVSMWRGENEKIGEEDEDWDEVKLLPPGMKSIKVIWRTSNELARMAFISVANVAQQDMTRKVRRAMDRQFLTGAGDGIVMPKGLLQSGQGFQTIPASPWSGPDSVYDVVDTALGVDANPSSWLLHPWNLTATRRWVGTDGHPLLAPDPQDGITPRLAGYPVRMSTLMPKDKVILADWSTIAIGRDLDVRVTALPERWAEYDQYGVRIVMRMDIKPLLPEAVVVATVPAATGTLLTAEPQSEPAPKGTAKR